MGKRMTIRLGDEAYEKLQKRSQEANLDFSFLIRKAIEGYLEDEDVEQRAIKVANPVMPDEAFALAGPFRGWSGDLRVELRQRFLELLALAHTTAKNWPKTRGIREVYIALLSAGQHLGIGQDGRHD